MTVRCLWTVILFPCGYHSLSRECCRTGKRGQPEEFTPWLQIACFPCHKTSSENLVGLTIAMGRPYFNSHSKLHLQSERRTPPKSTPKEQQFKRLSRAQWGEWESNGLRSQLDHSLEIGQCWQNPIHLNVKPLPGRLALITPRWDLLEGR
jgi:hypothetical protein